MMGVSRERIRQIQDIAIGKLKKHLGLRAIRNAFVHKQGMVEWESPHPATDTKNFGEDESHLFHSSDYGELGV